MPLTILRALRRATGTSVVALAALLAVPAASFALVPDTTPPTILINSPVPDETFGTSSTVTIAYDYGDDSPPVTVECSIDAVTLSDCPLGKTVTGLGSGAHTLVVTATDSLNNSSQATTHFTVDGTPPETTQEAPVVNRDGDVTFKFASSEPGSWKCRLDSEGWVMCGSPMIRRAVADGHHVMSAVAVDRWGNEDATPAVREFDVAVDRTAPVAQITSGPAEFSTVGVGSAVTFGFSADDAVRFICALQVSQGMAPLKLVSTDQACSSPKTYAGLPAGMYQFSVFASDATGNTSRPASRDFIVGTFVPSADVPPSTAVVGRALGAFAKGAAQLLAKGGIEGLLKGTATPVAFAAPSAGRVRLDLTAPVASSAAKGKKARRVVVATATKSVSGAGTVKLGVKVTAAGRTLLRRAKRVSLTVTTSFTPKGATKAQTTSGKVTVKRKPRR